MKLLHVIATADPRDGGPIEGVLRLGESFRAMGHSQELLTLDSPDAPWVSGAPAPIHAMGRLGEAPRGPLDRLALRFHRAPAAPRWLRAHAGDYDGIIVDGLWNYSTRTARLALPGGPTPYVVFSHGMLDPWFASRFPVKHAIKQLLWRFNEGVLLRGAAAVAFTCEQERKLARENWRPWGMREAVVGFGTSPPPPPTAAMEQAFRAAVPTLGERPYLLFLSRLHEKKGVDVLLEAFGAMAQDCPYDLVVAGPGEPAYVASLKALAERQCPAGRVHWPGMVSGDAKWGALHGCAAMVLTSHQENFGVVVAEAVGCGRPVVISDQVNIHDEVAAARAGLVCRDEANSARDALARFSTLSAGERAAMGERGRTLFAEKFTMDSTARRLLAIFEGAQGVGTQ
ncbi:MAG: glycosyltransferase [Sphingomonadales bacterium]|nr:glycosyltransferase [Sphingomonadales bacterium]MBD3773076.1 glycosyltransferase [Paracoccaceae bacterium]